MGNLRLVGAFLLLGACGGGRAASPTGAPPNAPKTPSAQAPAAPATAVARKLEQDETIKTSSGATLMVPKGWYVTSGRELLLLEEPDREVKIALVELKASDRDSAVAGAWSRFQPDFNLPVVRAVDLPPREGWDAVAQVAYVTKTEEARTVIALARRKGETWYVALLDGKDAAVDRRGAQANIALRSLKPPGLERESFAGREAHPLDGERAAQLTAFIDTARLQAGIPGVTIAVVQAGKIVYEQGFGVKQLGVKAEPVTPDSLFMIGSVTKSLTSLLMAKLVDRGLFQWTTPVTQILPAFALGDPAVTQSLAMQHTVCACTGLPRQDLEFIFEYGKSTPEGRVASMKTIVPTTGFGETFQYSNTMVSTGGYVAAHALYPKQALGPAYDKAIQAEVFGPLGMRATTMDFGRAARSNHAMPHARALGTEFYPIAMSREEALISVRPAGAAWSNVRDMSRFLLLELAKGSRPRESASSRKRTCSNGASRWPRSTTRRATGSV